MKKKILSALLIGTAAIGMGCPVKMSTQEDLETKIRYEQRITKLEDENKKLLEQFFDGKYDNSNLLVENLNEKLKAMRDSMYPVEAEYTYERTYDGRQVKKRIAGSSSVIFDEYLLTANHLLNSPEEIRQMEFTPRGTQLVTYRLIERKITIKDKEGKEIKLTEVVCQSKDADFAVIKLPEKTKLHSFPYKLGSSDDLEVGNIVYVIGNPMGAGKNIRTGIVTSEKGLIQLISSDNTFDNSSGINPGDSGGMIIAIRDGQFELVGIPHAKMHYQGQVEQMGEAVGISAVKRTLKEIFEGDKELQKKYKSLYDKIK